ncbi:transposase [Thermoflexus sp.]|uniref:transposase n=1 Tax=Thermoflexus sp. TaxID=1969742 RepID=UPI0035E40402
MHPIEMRRWMGLLLDDPAIRKARSPRRTEMAAQMSGTSGAASKRPHRFLRRDDPAADPRRVLWRWLSDPAEFVPADPTEIEWPQARASESVRVLQDGKTRGVWALMRAVPDRGRAIPCGRITYSSKTLAERGDSRNRNHFQAFAAWKDLLGERPWVLDREVRDLEWLRGFAEEAIHWVIRWNLGSPPPQFLDSEGQEVALEMVPGGMLMDRDVGDKGPVPGNGIGLRRKGCGEPLGRRTDWDPNEGLRMDRKRMRIEEKFRDRKSRFGMGRLMNKRWGYREQMRALLWIGYATADRMGERWRDFLYGELIGGEGNGARRGEDSGGPAAETMETALRSLCSA